MGFRRKSRELALQILFQTDFNRNQPKSQVASALWYGKKLRPQVKEFTECLVAGVAQYQTKIDTIIQKYTEHWSTGRMTVVDRNILRFSVFELFYLKEIPPKVTISEAIEIAKIYGTSDSSAFVNGILDHIHHDLTSSKPSLETRKTD